MSFRAAAAAATSTSSMDISQPCVGSGTNKIDYDWLTNLSGQDYPVSSLAEFSRELSQSPHDGFLHHFDVLKQDPQEMSPMAWPARHGYDRYYYQYTKLKNDLNIAERAALRIPRLAIERLTDKLRINTAYGLMIGRPPDRNPFTPQFRCYAGSYWHTIRRRCADHLLEFFETNPKIVGYFRKVLIPDESFVQTILANHAEFRFANDNRRYFDMRGSRLGHPKVLTEGDIPQFAGRRYVFARKIEWACGPTMFDKLDRYALGPERPRLGGASDLQHVADERSARAASRAIDQGDRGDVAGRSRRDQRDQAHGSAPGPVPGAPTPKRHNRHQRCRHERANERRDLALAAECRDGG